MFDWWNATVVSESLRMPKGTTMQRRSRRWRQMRRKVFTVEFQVLAAFCRDAVKAKQQATGPFRNSDP